MGAEEGEEPAPEPQPAPQGEEAPAEAAAAGDDAVPDAQQAGMEPQEGEGEYGEGEQPEQYYALGDEAGDDDGDDGDHDEVYDAQEEHHTDQVRYIAVVSPERRGLAVKPKKAARL